MNETRKNGGSSPATGLVGLGSVATSLFGGAILATVATASLAQANYFGTAGSLALGLAASTPSSVASRHLLPRGEESSKRTSADL